MPARSRPVLALFGAMLLLAACETAPVTGRSQMMLVSESEEQQLGLQDVEINGIPDDSRVAEVIFEADYRLKMIGVGELPGGPGVPSVFDLFPKTGEVKSRRMDAHSRGNRGQHGARHCGISHL